MSDPSSSCPSSSAATNSKNEERTQSTSKACLSDDPQPGCSSSARDGPVANLNFDVEPKPGPSTTAADFDLEVFDSGSSCSLEDCWGFEEKKTVQAWVDKKVSKGDQSEEDELVVMSNPQSACPSETEEAISEDEDIEDEDKEDEEEEDRDHCQCPKSLIALPPLRLTEAVAKKTCWKCAGPSTSSASMALCHEHAESTENIDEIVQDHDNFGTDENEDDSSLDSTAMSVSMSSLTTASDIASYSEESRFPASAVADNDYPAKVGGGFKRKSTGEESLAAAEADAKAKKKKRGSFGAQPEEQEICVPASAPEEVVEMSRLTVARPLDVVDTQPYSVAVSSAVEPPKEIDEWVATFGQWSHAQRLVAIDHLIGRCHPTQVRHMMAVIEPQFQRDFISLLPKELALYVLSFLHPRDLLRAAQTCRYWRILAEDNLLWREKCREAGLEDVHDMMHQRRRKPGYNFMYSAWKSGFMRQHNIEINWRVKGVRTPKVLKGHDDHVITCLQFSNNRIVSGSDDNTLKVWHAGTGKCLRTLVGHTGGVWSSQMEGNIIVSGSTDRSLKVWNADTGHCDHTLYGHTSTVRCMHLNGSRVVSGSRDATLRMWDITTGECLHVLVGHVAAVRCVQYDGRLVVSGAYDYMVKVWNPETEECLHTLSGHTNRVYSLQFDGVHVVSGSLDTSIRVWDVETGACKHALMGHQSLTSGMELRNNILVSGNADSTVKVWDITTGQCLQTLSGPNKHQSAVTCLQFNSKFVVTSSDDGTVKLWDVKTGEFLRDLVALESGGSGGVVWRIRANATKLVCAVGSRNGTEETKLLVLDFDVHECK